MVLQLRCIISWSFVFKSLLAEEYKSLLSIPPPLLEVTVSRCMYTKTWTIAWNREFESCLWIRCLSSQHIFRFFHFCCSIFLCLWLFAHFCVVLLNAPLSDWDKSNVVAMGYFSREILIQRHWRLEVPLSHWLAVSVREIISWRGEICLRTSMI